MELFFRNQDLTACNGKYLAVSETTKETFFQKKPDSYGQLIKIKFRKSWEKVSEILKNENFKIEVNKPLDIFNEENTGE